ncbi:hypothetical protein [Lachnospira sp.]|jgi:hypothetical protein|uniref:hypothetical protein n=1 Tax=Lachnospira sp. TaxID=2049031 RepID=UPI0025794A86|nr:hypothetical protein [Lachnospira sp.]
MSTTNTIAFMIIFILAIGIISYKIIKLVKDVLLKAAQVGFGIGYFIVGTIKALPSILITVLIVYLVHQFTPFF